MDKDSSPDYLLASYEKTSYEVLGDRKVRVFGKEYLHESIKNFLSESVSVSYTEGQVIIISLKIPP